jgi:PIN domain nuclease of toxin-antitoxin system
MANADAVFVVSVATIWELAIKQGLGQLRAPPNLPERIRELGYDVLAVSAEHAWQVRGLPRHHGDPFDRLLIAQAQVEDIPLVTHDRQLERYDVRIIRA